MGAALVLAIGIASPVAAFEGTVKWRMLKVATGPLAKVAGDASDSKKVFAVPLDVLMQMHGEATVSEATLYVKGSRIRAENDGGPGYFLMDLDSGTTEVVVPEQRKVIEVTREDLERSEARGRAMKGLLRQRIEDSPPKERQKLEKLSGNLASERSSAPADIVALEETQTINGMKTTAYQVRAGGETVKGWVTRDHPELQEMLIQLGNKRAEIARRDEASPRTKELLVREGVPVRVQTLDAKSYTWEDLVEVQVKPLADDLFVAPADFTRTNASDLRRRAEGPPSAPAAAPKP